MHWGFECHNGWADILDMACANIQNNYENDVSNYEWQLERYNKTDEEIAEDIAKVGEDSSIVPHLQRPPEPPSQLVASQVKEKYGTLRFYANGGSDEDEGVISMAESMSGRTCEICGNPGRCNDGGWISCRCQRCLELMNLETEERMKEFERINEELVARILKDDAERKKMIEDGWNV